ncbi:CCL22 protein, partial [Erythrocercus mccallii]|nr:CCL22 protein [Erythrocercus mccallii]
CCFSYTRLPIPQRVVRTVHVTSRACRLPAVVLVTKKNRKMCADPRMAWVQKLVEH